MKMIKKTMLVAFAGLTFLTSCDKDKDETKNLTLNITGLEDLGANFRYEGWIMVNGTPVTTGVFSVNASGTLSQTTFAIPEAQINAATKFILTIEPFPDPSAAPTATHILAGDFTGNNASLTIGAPEALGNNFLTATGKYVLATPSDADMTNEKSGVWFIGSLPPSAGLSLPTLPAGWKYEGWGAAGGKVFSTGTFTNLSAADEFKGFSGPLGTPPFPGEDFLVNAPVGSTFPINLSGGLAVISIEPFPDNSPAPFVLKPLLANIPAGVMDHTVYNMVNNATASSPTGTAVK